MSFRAFVFNCAICGGWAALFGWVLGRLLAGGPAVGEAGVKGMLLGLFVAVTLGFIDSFSNFSFMGAINRYVQIAPRVLVGMIVGMFGGLIGGVVGQLFFGLTEVVLKEVSGVFFVLGWTITGFLIGVSLGLFDVLFFFVKQENLRGPIRKVMKGILGGTLGGILGGVISLVLKMSASTVFPNRPTDWLWSPSAWGFVALGMCIGLMIGLAQVLLRESWVRVEAGLRPGRELILTRPIVTIGRAESCDIGLFGDPNIEKLHARILQQGDRYLIADEGTRAGTYLNGRRVAEPTPLKSNDLIQIGNSALRFSERQKREE